jgi:hypothetical protein
VPGNSSISITDNGHDFFMAHELEALWMHPIEIVSVSPTMIAVGSFVQVRISHVEQALELACRFGSDDLVARAYSITQSELRCSAPMIVKSSTHLHLVDSTNPGNVLSNFVQVRVERLVAWSLEPCTGPENGGSSITVFGQ